MLVSKVVSGLKCKPKKTLILLTTAMCILINYGLCNYHLLLQFPNCVYFLNFKAPRFFPPNFLFFCSCRIAEKKMFQRNLTRASKRERQKINKGSQKDSWQLIAPVGKLYFLLGMCSCTLWSLELSAELVSGQEKKKICTTRHSVIVLWMIPKYSQAFFHECFIGREATVIS